MKRLIIKIIIIFILIICLIVVNNELLSPQEELVQDIISILHVFSCRIYGMRKYKKQIEEDEDIVKSIQSGTYPN